LKNVFGNIKITEAKEVSDEKLGSLTEVRFLAW
jgi:hypothetical protein